MGGSSSLSVSMLLLFLLLLSSPSLYLDAVNSSYPYVQQQQHQLLCHNSERSALLQFRQSFLIDEQYCASLDDPYAYPKVAYPKAAYPKAATWDSSHDRDCCSWDGVECDGETGRVIGLRLANSCLFGSINSSSSLFHLRHLRTLDLSYNHFNYSRIPPAITRLSKLTTLDLSYAFFSGEIPLEGGLLALPNLVFLHLFGDFDISRNPLLKLQKPGLRGVVQNWPHLKALHLSGVAVSSTIPHELANLSSLTSLRLEYCELHGEFPTDIFRLPRLQVLSVRYNPNLIGSLPEFQQGSSSSPLQILHLAGTNFSGELPTSIGRLSSLTELDIHWCYFTGIVPSALGHLPQLSYLDLSYNSFRDPIPSSFANLTLLTHLDLSFNNFQVGSALSWLGRQTKLTVLHLGHTQISGEIPCGSLVNMSQLSALWLFDNQLSGQIPPCIVNLTRLTTLYLSDNELEGSIPSSLFESLVDLEELSLAFNQLNGTVELHMFSRLKNLSHLQLSGNKLSLLSHNISPNATFFPKFRLLGLADCNFSEFPDFLRNQDELVILFLSRNNIHGSIPKWLWNVSKETLQVLDLSKNFLTGFEHPPAVLPWSALRDLRLDSNMLQGPLPVPPPSTILYTVSGNELRGPIPPDICNMTSLMVLDLSSNSLSGNIPPCLAKFGKSLRVLDLGSNNFSGPIPETCTVMPNTLEVIDLGENQFQGRLPKSLANCLMLEHLVLGNNQIHDIFPSWLEALPHLKVLILHSNRFHGAIRRSSVSDITTTFSIFPNLHIIDLSDNEFIGDLPSEYFQHWDAMKLSNGALVYMQANSTYKEPGYTMSLYYEYSMTIANKGLQRLYEKIPDTLIAIDLSGNKFTGQIPASVGMLQGLHMLNLGRNDLSGPIPSSLGNLTQLESLDLSQNKLSGGIPWQLTSLKFLGFFNVSHNNLTGPIPQGQQLTTRPNDSFIGNPGLCGFPLSRACDQGLEAPLAPSSSSSEQDQDSIKFDWKIVLMGYGSGLVIGVSIGYCFTAWKHDWFLKAFGRNRQRYSKWVRTERMGLIS